MNKKELLEDLTALANILMDNCKPKQLNKHDLQKYYEIEERIQKLQNEVEENKFKHTLYFDDSQGDYVGSWFYSANEYRVSEEGLEKLHMCGHLGFTKEDFQEGIDYVKVKGNK